jgi:hypothetical protein
VAATAPGADTQAYVDIVERVEDLGGAIIVVAVALIGTLLGFLLLAAAFIRARTVPLFVPLLIIVGIIVVGPVGGGSESRIPQVIGNLLLLGGFGTIGLILLRQTDEEWERPGLATGGTAVATGAPAARPAGTSEGSSGTG